MRFQLFQVEVQTCYKVLISIPCTFTIQQEWIYLTAKIISRWTYYRSISNHLEEIRVLRILLDDHYKRINSVTVGVARLRADSLLNSRECRV